MGWRWVGMWVPEWAELMAAQMVDEMENKTVVMMGFWMVHYLAAQMGMHSVDEMGDHSDSSLALKRVGVMVSLTEILTAEHEVATMALLSVAVWVHVMASALGVLGAALTEAMTARLVVAW